jgi:phage baseplate assembly protein W
MASFDDSIPNFLGRGFGFPPSFAGGQVRMVEDEVDIHESLQILFGTLPGERVLQPQFGLDLTPLLFEPLSTTLRTLLLDRITTSLLIHEPRIRVMALVIDDSEALQGLLQIRLDYSVRSSNSRFNLVYPYYLGDANELRSQVLTGAR